MKRSKQEIIEEIVRQAEPLLDSLSRLSCDDPSCCCNTNKADNYTESSGKE